MDATLLWDLVDLEDFLRSRVYFLMELVSGGELLDALDSLGLLKYSQAALEATGYGSKPRYPGEHPKSL